jgi:hypothetical protein
MSVSITAYVKAQHVKLLQEAMKGYEFRFMFNPYPVKRSDPINSDWRIGIDYGSATPESIQEFETFWLRLETPITETYRKTPLLRRLTNFFRGIRE